MKWGNLRLFVPNFFFIFTPHLLKEYQKIIWKKKR